MKTSFKALLIATICISLSACESINTFSSSPKGETTVRSDAQSDYSDMGMGYNEITREMSNGSVEIYGFDDPVPVEGARFDGGMPSNDPNVTVYPIGDMPTYGAEVQPVPALMPPSRTRAVVDSPFGGPLQEPAVIDSTYEPQSEYMPAPIPAARTSVPAPMAPVMAENSSKIYFAHGSSRINAAGRDVIDHVANTAAGPVSVEGHASSNADVSDPVERRIVNLKMSMDRAFEVSKNLIRSGVPFDHVTAKAYGEAVPAAPIAGVDQEAANRRVEIVQANQNSSMPATARAPVPMAPRAYQAPEPVAPVPPLVRY